MIRLGDAIINEEQIEYIVPIGNNLKFCPASEGSRTKVMFLSGRNLTLAYPFNAAMEDLFANGIIYQDNDDLTDELTDADEGFTAAEVAELRRAYKSGYHYVARDKDGKVYAFVDEPVRHGAYWDCRSLDNPGNMRLDQPYQCIRWDVNQPLCIDSIPAFASWREVTL